MKRRNQGKALVVVLLIALLGGLGYAGYVFFVKAKTPEHALTRFLTAAKNNDEATVNELADRNSLFLNQFGSAIGANEPVALIFPGYQGMREESVDSFTVGQAKTEEHASVVDTTLNLKSKSGESRRINVNYHMKKTEEGKWMVAVEQTAGNNALVLLTTKETTDLKKMVQSFLRQNPAAGAMLGPLLNQYPQIKQALGI
ncbi:MAG: hypothetical protein HUU60_04320 [Armatimonadetes bacterium]|nr:hypothetical protein [Armatimonadota bacterium]